MSLLWIEGFETFGDAIGQYAQVGTKYYTDSSYYATGAYYKLRAGRWGGYALEFADANIHITTPCLTTTDSTLTVGFNFYVEAIQAGSSSAPSVGFYDDTALRIGVVLTATGEFAVYRGTTLLGTTTGAAVQAGQWCFVELQVLCHATTGAVVIRVDEVTRLTLTDVNTRNSGNAYYNRVRFRGVSSSTAGRFDDIYILDATGQRNNTFLGRKRVVAVFPSSSGDANQWTASAGDNWGCVDEQNPNTSDYVQTDVSGNADLYTFSSIAGVTGGVVGVQINVLAASTTDGVPWQAYLIAKPQDSMESDGDAVLVTSASYHIARRVLETNPKTGSMWTTSDLNGTQFGLKLA